MKPIGLQSIVANRSLLKYPEVFGSLDRGCSLTKVLYVKSIPDQPSKASLEMAVFSNSDIEQVLDWIVARAAEEADSAGSRAAGRKFRVTGVGGDKYRSTIAERLSMEVEFVDEFISQQTGAHFLLSNFEDEQFCYPDEISQARPAAELPEWMAALLSRTDRIFAETDGKRLPVIFGFCGSATGFNMLNEDGSTEVLGVSWFAGKSFLGLSQLLLGTNSYDEVMELAARGNRGGVDTQAKDMMAQDEKSEYRMIPPECPLFPFGKASDGARSFSREDLAASIVGSVISSLLPQIGTYCKTNRVRSVYLGGHFFRSQVARNILQDFVISAPSARQLRIRFLSNGHTGCIGALQLSQAEAHEFRQKLNTGKS